MLVEASEEVARRCCQRVRKRARASAGSAALALFLRQVRLAGPSLRALRRRLGREVSNWLADYVRTALLQKLSHSERGPIVPEPAPTPPQRSTLAQSNFFLSATFVGEELYAVFSGKGHVLSITNALDFQDLSYKSQRDSYHNERFVYLCHSRTSHSCPPGISFVQRKGQGLAGAKCARHPLAKKNAENEGTLRPHNATAGPASVTGLSCCCTDLAKFQKDPHKKRMSRPFQT